MTFAPNAAHRNVECLVIGGGLAGAMAGLRLARAGRGVLLVERERAAHAKVCGEFLSPEAVSYLRAAGVDPLQLGAEQVYRLRLAVGPRVVETALPFTAHSLSRTLLDECLLMRAEEQGCGLLRGVAVEKLTRNEDRWNAQLTDGRTILAANAVLATGKHDLRGWARPPGSQNDLIGFKMHWQLAPQQTRSLRSCMELFLFRGGYGGLSLIENGIANLAWVVRRKVIAARGGWPGLLTQICAECRKLDECLRGAQQVWERPLAIGRIPYGYLARTSDRIWRVGDQAAVIPSFTGDGMAIALHSASLAAEMLLAGAGSELYQHALAAQLRRGMRVATCLSRFMTTNAARQLVPTLLGVLPPALRWIAAATRIPEAALPAHKLECKAE